MYNNPGEKERMLVKLVGLMEVSTPIVDMKRSQILVTSWDTCLTWIWTLQVQVVLASIVGLIGGYTTHTRKGPSDLGHKFAYRVNCDEIEKYEGDGCVLK